MNQNESLCPKLQDDMDSIVAALSGIADLLRGKTVLVTGGTGFFGKWLLTSFLELNRRFELDASMLVLSRNPKRFLNEFTIADHQRALSFLAGDVRDFNLQSDRTIDYMIHAATETTTGMEQGNPEELRSVIVDGTCHVLELAKKYRTGHLLFCSSGAVYGPQPTDLRHIPESFPCAPVTVYGSAKLVAENRILDAIGNAGLVARIARCFAFVGPFLNLNAHFAIGNFIRDGLENKPILVKGDGSPFRSWLYASDLAIWLWTLLLTPCADSIYNIGSEYDIDILHMAHMVAAAFGRDSQSIIVREKHDSTRQAVRYVPDVSKIARDLGLVQTVSLNDAIQKVIAVNR